MDPRANREESKSQHKNSALVKGKKAIARARVSLEVSSSAERDKPLSSLSQNHSNTHNLHSLHIQPSRVQPSYVQPNRDEESKQGGEGSSNLRALAEFQFLSVS